MHVNRKLMLRQKKTPKNSVCKITSHLEAQVGEEMSSLAHTAPYLARSSVVIGQRQHVLTLWASLYEN